jgi:hypothetical protein
MGAGGSASVIAHRLFVSGGMGNVHFLCVTQILRNKIYNNMIIKNFVMHLDRTKTFP